MGMYLIAPPIAFGVVAAVAGFVIALASRKARRADWLEENAAETAAASEEEDE